MKFFLDTASIDEIREAAEYGLIDGVTTNPSLVAKEGRNFKDTLREITRIVNGPISAEVVSTDCVGIIREVRDLAKIHENIVVKVPMIQEGVKALNQLSGEGIRTNVTALPIMDFILFARPSATSLRTRPFSGRLSAWLKSPFSRFTKSMRSS